MYRSASPWTASALTTSGLGLWPIDAQCWSALYPAPLFTLNRSLKSDCEFATEKCKVMAESEQHLRDQLTKVAPCPIPLDSHRDA